MKYSYTLLLFILIIFISSCELINPDDDIPAHIQINSFECNTKPMEGTDSMDIVDAWLYVDGEVIGAFEIPVIIPVLSAGKHQIEVDPGVLVNGIAATRSINPFFESYFENVDFVPGSTLTIQPTSGYIDNVIFPWNSRGEEDFEEGGISIDSINGTSTIIAKSDMDVYEGGYSGRIFLDKAHPDYAGQSTMEFVLPKSGAAVVMEIHIKNTEVPIAIGMFVNKPGTVINVNHLGITPGPHWKKIYVNFSELVSYYPTATSYRVTFKAELGSTLDSTNIFLDNIKIMHL